MLELVWCAMTCKQGNMFMRIHVCMWRITLYESAGLRDESSLLARGYPGFGFHREKRTLVRDQTAT